MRARVRSSFYECVRDIQADFFALVLMTCSTVNSFSADIRSLAGYISKLENCYFRYAYLFAIIQHGFNDKIQNDLCNYEKLLVVLLVRKLTSSRTSGHIKHSFCTINFQSSSKCCCFFVLLSFFLWKIEWERNLLLWSYSFHFRFEPTVINCCVESPFSFKNFRKNDHQ